MTVEAKVQPMIAASIYDLRIGTGRLVMPLNHPRITDASNVPDPQNSSPQPPKTPPAMKPVLLVPFMFLTLTAAAPAGDPAWWTTRGVKTGSAASNLSPATIGQAKHMAAMALAELEGRIPAPVFTTLEADVNAVVDLSIPNPLPADWDEKHRAPLLTGQLKALAKPIYDKLRSLDYPWVNERMHEAGISVIEPASSPVAYSPYPWTSMTTDDSNHAVATTGQLKAVFSLPFESWGEYLEEAPDYPSGSTDSDGDGLSDVTETAMGTSPVMVDSDGDGVPDNLDHFPLDPARAAAPSPSPGDFTPPIVTLDSPATATLLSGP